MLATVDEVIEARGWLAFGHRARSPYRIRNENLGV